MSETTFSNVSVDTKANIYFAGRVISYSVHFDDSSKKTLGLIFPGRFHFGTAAPERMEIISGACTVVMDGTKDTLVIDAGASFEVAGNSGFTITVDDGICEYICTFLKP